MNDGEDEAIGVLYVVQTSWADMGGQNIYIFSKMSFCGYGRVQLGRGINRKPYLK